MFEEINGYYPSFSAYWKKCQRHIQQLKWKHTSKKLQ
jgi:hypothetical protein